MLNQHDNQCNGDTERSAEALAIDDLHISATAAKSGAIDHAHDQHGRKGEEELESRAVY
jgi:hypothetical protein